MRACLLLMCLFLVQISEAQTREITRIKGDLYRFQNDSHYSVFLVTDEGIVVTDPINKEAATWLKQELCKQYNLPVTHLIYSHDHADHISGGEVFGDEVLVIGHRLTKEAILRENMNVPIPEIIFDDKYTLEVGEQKVKLLYPGRSHGDNCIVIHFPGQSTVFVVDFITVNRLPYRNLGGGYMPDWIQAIKFVEGLDFEILAPGHGAIGTKNDVVNHRLYFEALKREVSKAMTEGKSLAEMQQTITLEEFKDFGNYQEWLELNIEGMYNMLQ